MNAANQGKLPFRPIPTEGDIRVEGLTLLAEPPSATLDVVFVHGFTGHPRDTWVWTGEIPQESRATAGSNKSINSEGPSKLRRLFSSDSSKKAAARVSVFWPQDLLPTTLPNARVFTYGYDSRIRHSLGVPASKSTLYDLGHELLINLEAKRNREPSRPLVFIAHSLGGIVIKEALRRSEGCHTYHKHLHSVFKATTAIICFGTPHSGADPRGLVHHVAEVVVRAAGYTVNDELINNLLPSSEKLRELRDQFSRMSHSENWMLFSFQEQYGLKLLHGRKVVEDYSSTFGDPTIEITQHIASNHMDICRFKGHNDGEYEKVAAALHRISQIIEDGKGQKELCSDSRTPDADPTNIPVAVTADHKKSYLESLSFLQIDSRLLNIKKAHEKTCHWLFEQAEYKQWLDRDLIESHRGFLWIKAKPGAGKSTMMKYVLLNTKKLVRGAMIISFFFNARGDVLEKSTLGMYRSLCLQLLKAIHPLQEEFVRMFSEKSKSSDTYELTIEELKEFLFAATKSLQQHRIICFIDALDECEENEVRDLIEFLEDLGTTAVSSQTSLNICLSSRHYPHINIRRGIQLTMEGQGGHNKDVEIYVESKLKIPHSQQMDDIRAEVLRRASGVFLWVILVVQMLNKEYDHGQIHALRRRLKEIPDELDSLFADILNRDVERRNESILCLQWLLFARRPLTSEELYFAVLSGTDPSALGEWDPAEISDQTIDRFILSCSKGLAEVSKAKDKKVQFIHESVRDFLLLRNGFAKLQADLAINIEGISHDRLKRCCYQYIMSDMFEDLLHVVVPTTNSQEAKDLRTETSAMFPFLKYAVHNILSHADTAQSRDISQHEFLPDFASPSFMIQRWVKFDSLFQIYHIRQYTENVHLLYILVENNLSHLVKVLLDGRPDVNVEGERYGNALQAASVKSYAEIAQLLIDAGADFNRVAGEHGDSLTAAIVKGHEKVIELLLDVGASQSTASNGHQLSLLWAAQNGYGSIFRKLLADFTLDPNLVNREGKTALSIAAGKGDDLIVQLLITDPRVDLNWRDKLGRTALFNAVISRHGNAVQLLLANPKIETNLRDSKDETPLLWAVKNGNEVIVRLLLKNPKINPNLKDRLGMTTLSYTALMKHETMSQLLLTNPEVDFNLKDNFGRTPLSLAAAGGNEGLLQALLAHPKVDPNAKDNTGRTPLSWAVTSIPTGNHVELLLTYPKVDPDAKDDSGRTPLSWAASDGSIRIVKELLMSPRVDPDLKDNFGLTPLYWASHNTPICDVLRRAARRW